MPLTWNTAFSMIFASASMSSHNTASGTSAPASPAAAVAASATSPPATRSFMSRAASDPLASSLAGTMSVSIENGLLL